MIMGNFGSGKTELALHFALQSASIDLSTTLVDLDIVNPYFRASERRQALLDKGINLITPKSALDEIEMITIDPRIYSAFVGDDGVVIFDVGGDGVGARALGQYKAYFDRISKSFLKVWLVVNPHRPQSSTAERIIHMINQVELASRLKLTGLINNTNMSTETTESDLIFGYDILKQVAIESSLPVVYTSGEKNNINSFLAKAADIGLDKKYIGQPLQFDIMTHRDWNRFIKLGM